jgi:hypothetical protein
MQTHIIDESVGPTYRKLFDLYNCLALVQLTEAWKAETQMRG